MYFKHKTYSIIIVVLTIIILCLQLCEAIEVPIKQDAHNNFIEWSNLAQDEAESPAWVLKKNNDITYEWVAPNGNAIKTIVRQPEVKISNTISLVPFSADLDARVLFEDAIEKAKKSGVNTLKLSKNAVYTFKTLNRRGDSHWLLENLTDFTIDGNGATLVFENDFSGILIQQSKRILIKNLTLKFNLRSSSLGQINVISGRKVLVVNDNNQLSTNDRIYQLAEVNINPLSFIPDGKRLIYPPNAESPQYIGNQSYISNTFSNLNEGTNFVALQRWYSGSAIHIGGKRNEKQTEDITISNVKVFSTPGIGVTVAGLKRGLAITDSIFESDENDSLNVLGPTWDGIHVNVGGGDIVITGCRFRHLGDDAININSPIHPIHFISYDKKKIIVSKSANFIKKNDQLAFFDGDGNLIAKAHVVEETIDLKKGRFEVTLDSLPQSVSQDSFVRDINLIPRRYVINKNIVSDINGHGILAQIPHGLILENSFLHLCRNAIRLLTSVGQWNEGVGAFNVIVRNNNIYRGGTDHGMFMPWASISVYGGIKDSLSPSILNQNIEIADNKFDSLRQGCVSVVNADNVRVSNNQCGFIGKLNSIVPIMVIRSKNVIHD